MGARIDAPIAEQRIVSQSAWLGASVPYAEFALAGVAAGLWYTQGGSFWYAGAWPGPWPLALLGASWLLRLARTGFAWRMSPLDIPLWLFLASAGVGVWAAYDRGPAWAAFWLLVGAAGLYYAIAGQPDLRHVQVVLVIWGLFGAALSVYFLASNDWAAHGAKAPVLAALGQRIQGWLPALTGHRLSPNVTGGILAPIMPLYIALLAISFGRTPTSSGPLARLWPLVWAVVAGAAALGWLISLSRGAWVATLGMGGLWGLWRAAGRWSRRTQGQPAPAWRARLWLMGGLLVVGAAGLAAVFLLVLAGYLPGTGALTNRLGLYRDALLLARDYRLIGAGLGMFPVQFAIYTLLIHVGYVTHSHNLYLSILVAQGLLGLLPYLGLAVAALAFGLRRLRHTELAAESWVIEAGLASLGVILMHGLVDDALYSSRGALFLFVPLGFILAAGRGRGDSREPAGSGARSGFRIATGVILLVLVLVVGIGWRSVAGAWYANLGAVAQAQAELSVYDQRHFDNPTLDQVRQRVDLDPAIRWLTRAIQVDATHPTARQRLASIDLARGRYADALMHMRAAWDAGHRDSVTRLLLGDALVAAGQPEGAAEVIRGLTWAESRLLGQAWSRYWVNQDYRRAADAWATVLRLNPKHDQADYWFKEAQRKLNDKKGPFELR